MRCPACSKPLSAQDFGVTVHVCADGCHGLWCGRSALLKLEERSSGAGPALQAALALARSDGARQGTRLCPACAVPLHARRYKRTRDVVVDECYSCGGYFLSAGDLRRIREERLSEAEEKAYADQVIASGGGSFAEAEQELAQGPARALLGGQAQALLGKLYFWKWFKLKRWR